MRTKMILLTLCVIPFSAAGAQFVPGEQTVTTCSDGPAFYAEVDTHAKSVHKVYGYRANGELAAQAPNLINAWVGVETDPRIFPLKKAGEGYLFATNDPGAAPQKAEMAFFLYKDWDNNGGYQINYHPFRTCEQASVSGFSNGDAISAESWAVILKKLAQPGVNKAAVPMYGKCMDNTGGHEVTDCSYRLTRAACETPDARCRWQASDPYWPPPSTDH